MGLRDEVNKFSRKAGSPCAVERVIQGFPAEDVEELRDVFDDLMVKASDLARYLASKGYKIDQSSITRHRRKECRCGLE